MLTIFKKLFGKAAPTPPPPPAPAAPIAQSALLPAVEVVHLSLTSITERFPDDLKSLLAHEPDPAKTVALPLPTILKQLPSGCVKMSLASLQRQANGLLQPIPPGDKRMIEVPLAEIFRHLQPDSLRRRPDQRVISVPNNGYNLFGDTTNPYIIAPDDAPQPQVLDLSRDLEPASDDAPRVLKMDDGMRAHFAGSSSSPAKTSAIGSTPGLKMEKFGSGLYPVAPPAPTSIPKPDGPTLAIRAATLTAGWPAEIRTEIEALDPETVVTLPLNEISGGLAKGRVAFSWGHIRAWLEPAPGTPTATAESSLLQLPLKIVAPAFLAATKGSKPDRKSVEMDESIPSLFSNGRAPEPEPAPAPAEQPAEEPTDEAQPLAVTVAAPVQADPQKVPATIGEVFGQPQKRDWTPSEMVAGTMKLPGVAGAIVALQEGLQVAAELPDGVKSEVVAAFLPQIFARLNQYSSEMKLGEVDDLLFTTHGAHCQIYRLGYVYLAVLGKPGEALPWHELRLISEELARQTHK